jgi:hypothetical protein
MLTLCLGHFIPRERAPITHWREGWVVPRFSLDLVVRRKIPSLRNFYKQKQNNLGKYVHTEEKISRFLLCMSLLLQFSPLCIYFMQFMQALGSQQFAPGFLDHAQKQPMKLIYK